MNRSLIPRLVLSRSATAAGDLLQRVRADLVAQLGAVVAAALQGWLAQGRPRRLGGGGGVPLAGVGRAAMAVSVVVVVGRLEVSRGGVRGAARE